MKITPRNMSIMDPLQTSNLACLVFRAARQSPEAIALIDEASQITYEELADRIQAMAFSLTKLGIQPGERIGLLLYNEPAYVISFFALLGLGAVVIPLNVRLTAPEISMILNDAQAIWLISSNDFHPVLGEFKGISELPALKGLMVHRYNEPIDAPFPVMAIESLMGRYSRPLLEPFPLPVSETVLATLVYTSGTTGKPKGVMLSHANIGADAWANAQVIEACALDRFITISPLFHVFGQTNVLITAIMVGATVVLIKKFSPKQVLSAIEQHRVTFMAAVPTMYQMMLSHLTDRANKPVYDLSSIRVCHSGAAAMPVALIERIESTFQAPVQEGYGLSEASSIVCSNPLHGSRKPGSVGPAIPGVTVRVVDDAGNVLHPGNIGELEVMGPTVMQGYLNRPEETAEVMSESLNDTMGKKTPVRWLRTKDMAYMDDDGYVYIVDRKDDVINVGGVKVYPREIEDVLYRHPAVQAVAVIGEPSALYHQDIKAFVVKAEGYAVRPDELYAHCKTCLALYKIPKQFVFVTEIPQGATGKILRTALRKQG